MRCYHGFGIGSTLVALGLAISPGCEHSSATGTGQSTPAVRGPITPSEPPPASGTPVHVDTQNGVHVNVGSGQPNAPAPGDVNVSADRQNGVQVQVDGTPVRDLLRGPPVVNP